MAIRMPSPDASWRDSARYPRFFIFDSRAVFPFMVWMLHWSWRTFIFAVVAMGFFSLLIRFGFTVSVFLRWLRSSIAGRRKSGRPWWT